MTTTDILTDIVLVKTEKTATIHAPAERVDIADWLLHLPDAEYQRCAPPDHIAAGTTTTDDGRPMSINVEVIGGSLMVQHYVAEVHEPGHCRMVSLSDVQTPAGWTKIQVIWDLSVTALDSASCQFTNQVLSCPTPAFLETLKVAGISFEDAVADRQAASADHNRRETALFHKVSNGRPWPDIRLFALGVEAHFPSRWNDGFRPDSGPSRGAPAWRASRPFETVALHPSTRRRPFKIGAMNAR
jgi:hypothetical protein